MNEEELIEKAKELMSIKRKINQLMAESNEIKQEIISALKEHGAVKLEFGRVYYGESKGASTFSRSNVLEYLRDAYGDALADQVDEDCTRTGEARQVVYVQVNDL